MRKIKSSQQYLLFYYSSNKMFLKIVLDDERKSISRNVSGYDNDFRTWKEENTVKGDQWNLAKGPPTVKSIFSLKHKDGNFE